MTGKTLEELLEDAEMVSTLITTAQRLMADGKSVDLSNLEGKIRTLCENAEAAQLEQPARVDAALSAILEDLNRLGNDMTSRHGDADGGPSLEDTIKRAIDAYNLDGGES